MRLLVTLMHGLHYLMGISLPPPEKERFYLFVWAGILTAMLFWTALLIFLFIHFTALSTSIPYK